MKKIRVLIVEDDEMQAEMLVKFLKTSQYEITAIANNVKDALGYFYSQKPDIVLLDIYLQGQPDGISFAETINENPSTVKPFIFMTSSMDTNTFDAAKITSPHSYLLKPFNPLELQFSIDLALEKFATEELSMPLRKGGNMISDQHLFVKKAGALIKVPLSSIHHIEVEGKYCQLVAKEGTFLIQKSLKQVALKLMGIDFIRVHRNYLVNLYAIDKVMFSEEHLVLNSGDSIPISQHFRKNITDRLDVLK